MLNILQPIQNIKYNSTEMYSIKTKLPISVLDVLFVAIIDGMIWACNGTTIWTNDNFSQQVQNWLELLIMRKNISWNVAETIPQHEISLMNFVTEVP